MRDETPSRTAAWVAAARGMGRVLPPEVRIADDPFGTAFASPRLARFLQRVEGTGPRWATLPGIGSWVLYMQVRTRVLDDEVRRFAAAHPGAQLVILGAGYDCRGLRLPELAHAAVFEVDHPATQRHKRDVLARLGASSPARYVTWNFEQRPMAELPGALADAGHDPTRPTITLWEGVTMYLTEPAIDASVAAIASYSAVGSRLGMTYFNRGRIDRPSLGTRALKALVAVAGEPYRWGWIPAELPGWMAARGFSLERDISLADAAHDLLPPPELARRVDDPDRRVAIVARESIAVAARS